MISIPQRKKCIFLWLHKEEKNKTKKTNKNKTSVECGWVDGLIEESWVAEERSSGDLTILMSK